MIIEGRVWKFGNNLKSSYFFNGKYDILGRQHKYEELASHILEDHQTDFKKLVKPGDVFVVGESFGAGKHLWGPVGAFRALGIQAVIGKSLATSWERNSLNVGYPSLCFSEIYELVETGDILYFDLLTGQAENRSNGKTIFVNPIQEGILELINVGGIASLTSAKLGIKNK